MREKGGRKERRKHEEEGGRKERRRKHEEEGGRKERRRKHAVSTPTCSRTKHMEIIQSCNNTLQYCIHYWLDTPLYQYGGYTQHITVSKAICLSSDDDFLVICLLAHKYSEYATLIAMPLRTHCCLCTGNTR